MLEDKKDLDDTVNNVLYSVCMLVWIIFVSAINI